MPKGIDPKAYAARVTRANKMLAAQDPAMVAKIRDMYPPVSKEDVIKSILRTRKDGGVTPSTKTVDKLYRPSK
jgi:hypothetical protein